MSECKVPDARKTVFGTVTIKVGGDASCSLPAVEGPTSFSMGALGLSRSGTCNLKGEQNISWLQSRDL